MRFIQIIQNSYLFIFLNKAEASEKLQKHIVIQNGKHLMSHNYNSRRHFQIFLRKTAYNVILFFISKIAHTHSFLVLEYIQFFLNKKSNPFKLESKIFIYKKLEKKLS